jgi:hypothetical protein
VSVKCRLEAGLFFVASSYRGRMDFSQNFPLIDLVTYYVAVFGNSNAIGIDSSSLFYSETHPRNHSSVP